MKIGDRVELHPGCDRWMMGDRFGVIVGRGRPSSHELHRLPHPVVIWRVKLDRSGKTFRFLQERLEVRQ